jgi:hypothetical protein
MGAQKRFDSSEVFSGFTQTLERFGLPGGQLEAQAEDLLGQFLVLRFELVLPGFADFFNAPRH